MLSLYCGEASSAERARRLNASAEGTLLVVPDELKRRVLAREWGGAIHTAGAIQVIALPDLIERLIPEDSSRRWASPGIVRAAIRSIIESEPRRFDYLVGAKSAPRLTEGVLNRIVSAMEAQTRKDATEEFSGNPSGRERQLRALLDTLHKRLDGSQVRQEKFALLQALSELSSEDWRRDFLDFEKVVFLDFDRWDDAGFMTVSAATRITKDVIVLLDFYPDAEHDAYLPLEPAYQRFYEMADHYILGADELESGEWAKDLSKVKLPVVISAKSKVEEIRAAVCVINSLFEGRQSGLKPTVTIALPNWEAYAPELERALEGVGEAVVWYRKVSALKCSKWKMLERVRDASHAQVSSGEIASLWRAPGFTGLTDGKISQVDAWELAARLDYITTLTGKVVGWPRIVRHVKMALRQLQSERNRRGLLSSEEIGLDDHLLAALEISHDLLKSFRGKRDISKWSEMVAAIWQKSLAGLSGDDQNLDQLISAMTDITGEMSEFSDFISDKPVRFSGYFGLLRTALHEVSEDNTDHFENALVTVCPASIASEIRSDVCFVLGCNDGNFPYFARPEPSFSDQWMRESQARVRGAQQQVLQQLAERHARLLLWMPEREGIEELLPSQLVEDLLEKGEASHTTADAFLVTMGLDINATTALPPQLEMVEALAGLVLSEPELKRFEKRGIQGHNIAVSNTIMAARSAEDLSFYDGIITDPVLKKWLAAWADRHIYSVSQLDTVVGCSYRFFSERLLNLDELEEADDLLPAHTFGSIVHGLLAHFYRDWVDCGGNIPGPKDEALAREKLVGAFELEEENIGELSDFAADLLRLKLFGDLSVKEFGSSKLPLVEVRNSGLLGQFLTMEMERAGAGGADGFRPRNFEVGFGQGLVEDDDPLTAPEPLDLQLGENQSIRLRGRIDRIDVSADGAFVVTDYKTGYVPMKAHIGEGFRTQLPVYLMVAEELLKAQFDNPEAAGGIYFPLKPADNPKISGMFIKKSYQAQLGIGGRSCLSEEDFNEVLDTVKVIMRRSLRAVRDGKLTTTWRDEKVVCAFCPFESFCYRDVERTRNFWDRQEIGVSGETG